jgi:hypothetical protein
MVKVVFMVVIVAVAGCALIFVVGTEGWTCDVQIKLYWYKNWSLSQSIATVALSTFLAMICDHSTAPVKNDPDDSYILLQWIKDGTLRQRNETLHFFH